VGRQLRGARLGLSLGRRRVGQSEPSTKRLLVRVKPARRSPLSLGKNGPVTAVFDVRQSFYDIYNDRSNAAKVYTGSCSSSASTDYVGGHAVSIVGWGTDANGFAYWLIENSWSNGPIKVSRGRWSRPMGGRCRGPPGQRDRGRRRRSPWRRTTRSPCRSRGAAAALALVENARRAGLLIKSNDAGTERNKRHTTTTRHDTTLTGRTHGTRRFRRREGRWSWEGEGEGEGDDDGDGEALASGTGLGD
jgi:hypothetical protein